jgi:hypothetical protein
MLHFAAEFLDRTLVRDAVMLIELHHFPDSKDESSQHEDGGPVLLLAASIH